MNIHKRDRAWPVLKQLLLASAIFVAHPVALVQADSMASTEQLVTEMSQRISAITRSSSVNGVIPRFNQAKSLGCFNATFRVHDQIDPEFKHGLFARPASYPARLRFANASEQDDSKKDIRGLSIKVQGVSGEPLWGQPGTQDFLFNSYPALFVATPEDFLDFIRARQQDKELWFFLNPLNAHLKSLWILYKARKAHLNPFDIRYWSTTPFQLGSEGTTVVKYSATPCTKNELLQSPVAGKNQLRSAMSIQLEQGPVCFNFGVQKRTDPEAMPIEDASVIWNEERSPFQTLATITIDKQPFDTPENLTACEAIHFNPWQSLPEHRPLGRMNEVRREVYQEAFKTRTGGSP